MTQKYIGSDSPFFDLASRAIDEGTLVDPHDAWSDPVFKQRLEELRHPEEDINPLVRETARVGVHVAGIAFATDMSEGDIYELLQDSPDGPERDVEELALIEHFGRVLLQQSRTEVTGRVYPKETIVKQTANQKRSIGVGILSMLDVNNQLETSIDRYGYPIHSDSAAREVFFPKHFGDYPNGGYVNCLGAAMMTAGVMGAHNMDAVWVLRISSMQDEITKLGIRSSQFYLESMKVHEGLPMWYEMPKVRNNLAINKNSLRHEGGWHPSVVTPVSNGRWMHVDPLQQSSSGIQEYSDEYSGLSDGVLDHRIKLSEARRRVEILGRQLPGLTIDYDTTPDLNMTAEMMDMVFAMTTELAVAAKSALRGLGGSACPKEDIEDFASVNYDELRMLYSGIVQSDQESLAEYLFMRSTTSMDSGVIPVDRPYSAGVYKKLSGVGGMKPNGRKIIGDILRAGSVATDSIIGHFRRSGSASLLNSNLEVGNIEFSVGAAALGILLNYDKEGNIEDVRRIANHSSSQMFWAESQLSGLLEPGELLHGFGKSFGTMSRHRIHPTTREAIETI